MVFYASYCILQDQKIEKILARGNVFRGLYIVDDESFHVDKRKSIDNSMHLSNSVQWNASLNNDQSGKILSVCIYPIVLRWHQRLSHPSTIVLKHIEIADIVNKEHFIPIYDVCHQSKHTRILLPIILKKWLKPLPYCILVGGFHIG